MDTHTKRGYYHNGTHRRTIRMRNYDYTHPGFYFVTICTEHHQRFLGEIIADKMHLNGTGQIIKEIWNTLPQRFLDVALDQYVLMPNHIHDIIIMSEPSLPQRQNTCVNQPCPHSDKLFVPSKGPQRIKCEPAGCQTLPGRIDSTIISFETKPT